MDPLSEPFIADPDGRTLSLVTGESRRFRPRPDVFYASHEKTLPVPGEG
jgi:hypothetical protein